MTHETARTPEHRFGRPLPTDPATLSDAIGLLLREALARRGWVLVPMLFYVVLVGFLDLSGAAQDPAVGVMLVALIGAAALGFQLGSQRGRVVQGALLVAVVALCVDPANWEYEPARFLLLTALLPCVLVPAQHDRVAALTTTLAAAALLRIAPDGAWIAETPLPPGWPCWTAAALAGSGVFFAARSRAWPLSIAAVAVPAVAYAVDFGASGGLQLLWTLVFVHLLALAARSSPAAGRDPIGSMAAAIHRHPALAAIVLAALLPQLLFNGLLVGLQFWAEEDTIILRTAELGGELTASLLLIGGACVAVVAARRSNAFGRLTAVPLIAVGLVSTIWLGLATYLVDGLLPAAQLLTELLASAPAGVGALLPALIGTAIAVWVGRAPPVALGAALCGVIWLDATATTPAGPWQFLVGLGVLTSGFGVLLTWGPATRGDRRELVACAGFGAAVALLLVTDWSSWSSWNHAPEPDLAFELFRTRLADFAVEAVGLGLGVVLFVDALRLGRAVFTSCPVPEWHTLRTDFAPGPAAPER